MVGRRFLVYPCLHGRGSQKIWDCFEKIRLDRLSDGGAGLGERW